MASEKRIESLSGSSEKRSAPEDGDGEKRQKISFGMSKTTAGSKPGLQFKLNTKSTVQPLVKKNTAVFNDDEEEPEEMPKEARMRMRNFGRDTPTSSGPNSFGKTKHGFCNVKKIYEKNLTEEAETAADKSK